MSEFLESAHYPVICQPHYDAGERLNILDDRKKTGGATQEERFQNQVVDIADRLRFVGYSKSSSELHPVQRKRLFNRQLPKNEWAASLQKSTGYV